MTTYTLTDAQRQQLLAATHHHHHNSYELLQSLTPHSGEVAAPSTSAVYIRRDQYAKAQTAPYLCEVGPEPREDRMPLYAIPQAAPSASQPQNHVWRVYNKAVSLYFWSEEKALAASAAGGAAVSMQVTRVDLLDTAPSTSQPLTVDQIYEVLFSFCADGSAPTSTDDPEFLELIVPLARAIEAKIKGGA